MRESEIGKWGCYGLIALGTIAFLWNAGIDVEYWATQAKTQRGAVEVGGASVIFQLMVLGFAGVAGALLFRAKNYWLGGAATVVLLFFLAYNMMSVMSFQARERIIPAKIAEENQRAQIDAALEAQTTQNSRQDDAIKTLRDDALAASLALKHAKTKQERASAQEAKRAADSAYVESSFATVTAKALPGRTTSSDPQAEFVAMLVPQYSIEQIQTIISAWWGAGLNLAKVICWFFGFGLMPKRKPEERAEATVPEQAEVKTPEAAKPYKLSVISNGSNLTTTAAPKSQNQVEQFLSEATRPAPGARITATTMHQHFIKWAELRGYPRLNANTFGRNMTALGVQRQLEAHANTYLGVGLAPLGNAEGRLLNVA